MANFNGFHELGEQISQIAEEFREEQKTGLGTSGEIESTRGAIQSGVNSAMVDIVEIARQRAEQYVRSQDADTIDHESLGWVGTNKYLHKFYAESDIVAFHEFGTGTKAEHPRYDGTVNAEDPETGQQGYLIDPPGEHPVAFDYGGQTIVVQYAVHPGVPAQHFMQNTLRHNTDKFEEEIGSALEERFSNLEDFR